MAEKERYYCDKFEEIYDSRIDRYPSNEAICHILNNQIERIKNLEQENKQLKQSQKQLAIEELKLALENFRNRPTHFDVARQEMCLSDQDKQFIDFINNRIKELRSEE